jgi:hypothetical protein
MFIKFSWLEFKSIHLTVMGVLALILLTTPTAKAVLLIDTNNTVTGAGEGTLNPADVSPALANPATGTTGDTIAFELNSSGSNQIIFEANPTESLVVSGSGQAGVAANDGLTSSIKFRLTEGVRRLEMNPNVDEDGLYEVTIKIFGGSSFTWNVNLGGAGQNRFLIFSNPLDSDVIVSGSITSLSTSMIVDLIQPRFGGVCDASNLDATCGTMYTESSVLISEPNTFALFGLGLVGLGFARRRKAA